MKNKFLLVALFLSATISVVGLANQPTQDLEILEIMAPSMSDKQMKQEALLTSKKWVCLDVSKKRLTKKLDFDIGNECSFSIDKKYSFKNNKYDYSNGTWKLDGKYLYLFYNAKGTDNKVETTKFQIKKLTETTLVLKRTEKPKGNITFK